MIHLAEIDRIPSLTLQTIGIYLQVTWQLSGQSPCTAAILDRFELKNSVHSGQVSGSLWRMWPVINRPLLHLIVATKHSSAPPFAVLNGGEQIFHFSPKLIRIFFCCVCVKVENCHSTRTIAKKSRTIQVFNPREEGFIQHGTPHPPLCSNEWQGKQIFAH